MMIEKCERLVMDYEKYLDSLKSRRGQLLDTDPYMDSASFMTWFFKHAALGPAM